MKLIFIAIMSNITGLRCIKTTRHLLYIVLRLYQTIQNVINNLKTQRKTLFYSVTIISVETSDDDDESGEGSQRA